MSLILDHLFVLTTPGAVVAADLIAGGFVEGSPNRHPGQGTSCRRFFFTNTMLELLYVRDATEARVGAASRFRFADRANTSGACPFGFVYRNHPEQTTPGPFPTWEYQPDYLPESLLMQVGDNSSNIDEPLAVVLPTMASYSGPPQPKNELSLTHLSLTIPTRRPSEVIQAMRQKDWFVIRQGKGHCLELEFDNGDAGQHHDLRPSLPMLIRR